MATRLRSIRWFIFVVVIFATVTLWAIRGVGRWLVVQDRLEPAVAIAVLSGRMPTRTFEAARLYRQGWAAQVWLTRPTGPGEELEHMGISFVSEEFYNQRVLIHLGVPAGAILILARQIINTADEVDVIARESTRLGASKVIIVTTKAHTRRVRTIWHRKYGSSPQAIVRYTSSDDFDADHWWRSTRDALDVLREVFGLANTWTGFPVKTYTRSRESIPRILIP